MIRLGGLGFWGGNPTTNPKESGSMGGDLLLIVEVVGLGGWQFGFKQVGQVSELGGHP